MTKFYKIFFTVCGSYLALHTLIYGFSSGLFEAKIILLVLAGLAVLVCLLSMALIGLMVLMSRLRAKFPQLSDEAIELLKMREVCDD